MNKVFVVIYSSTYCGNSPYVECKTFSNEEKARLQFNQYLIDIAETENLNKEDTAEFINEYKNCNEAEYDNEWVGHGYSVKLIEQEVTE